MAQTIKLKRSGTEGNIPTTSQLELGEVAINTYDGKMFIKKNVGGTESIVEISAAAADAILVEYQFTSTASQTTYSGSDDNTETLSYTPNAIQVFMNGILLDPGIDFTATNGTSIVLSEAADANDYLQIFAFKKKISDGQVSVDTFTGDDSTVAFTLSVDPGDENNTRVFIDGVYQSKANYSVSGTTLTFSTAPPTGTAIEIEIGNRVVTLDTLSDLDLPDDVKLRLGTGQDLQIYHDGSHSYIQEQGTGNLYLNTTNGGGVFLTSAGENLALFNSNGATNLYYDNSEKLATTNDGITVIGDVEADEFIGDVRGAVLFKAQAGENLAKGEVVYISGISGNTTVVSKADADDASKMPAFGLVAAAASSGNPVNIYTSGTISGIDTSSFSVGDEVFTSTTAGALTATPPTGESAALQKIGKVTRSDSNGSIFIIGAGRSNAVPNLDDGDIFIGNSSNQAVTASLNTKIEDYLDGGTSTPSLASLVIAGTNANLSFSASGNNIDFGRDADNYITAQTGSTSNIVIDPQNRFVVRTADTERMRISSSGAIDIANNQLGWYDNSASAWQTAVLRADDFQFKNAGGSVRLFIDGGSGSVGIGTTTPDSKLTVNVTSNSDGIELQSSEVSIATLARTAVNSQVVASLDGVASRPIHIGGIVNEDVILANAGGNVGIGTSSPLGKLAVEDSGTGSEIVLSRVGAVAGLYSRVGWTAANGLDIGVDNGNVLSASHITMSVDGSEAMRINSSGNVGIGTDSPLAKLHIDGDGTYASIRGHNQVLDLGNWTNGEVRIESTGAPFHLRAAGNQPLHLETNNVERVTVLGTGNVGIGTTSPLAKLHVNAGEIRIASSAAYNTHFNYLDGGSNIISQANAGSTEIRNSSSSLFYLNASGKVGIGTTSVNEMLQIDSADSAIRVNTTNAANNSELQLVYNNTTNGMFFRYHANTALAYIDNTYPRTQGYSFGDILFRQSYAGTMTEHMRLTAYDGYLGVFTANPKARLELNLHSGADSALMNTSSVNDVQLLRAGFGQNADTTSNADAKWGLRFVGRNDNTFDNGKSGAIYGVSEDSLGYNRKVGLAFHTSAFDAAHTERMRISSDGNVGIGVTNPSVKLAVAGALSVTSNITNNSAGHAYLTLNSGGVYESGIIYQRNSTSKWETYIPSGNDNYRFYSYGDGEVQLEIRDGVDGNGGIILSGLGVNDSTDYYGSYGALILDSNQSYTSASRSWMLTNALKANTFGILYSDTATTKPSLTTYGNAASGTSVALSINAEGNVGIGTDSPFNSTNYKTLNIRGTNGGQILLGNSSSSYTGYLYTQASGTVLGAIAGTRLEFHAGGAEKMRIASDGDFIVSNTDPRVASNYSTQAGLGWDESDLHAEIATTLNRSVLELGRNNANSGDVITIRQQSNSVGAIGTEGGDSLYIQSNGATGSGLRFHPSAASIQPVRQGVTIDDTISLGADTRRFKDLYLSGNAKIGLSSVLPGTTAALNVRSNTAAVEQFAIRVNKDNYADTGGHTTLIGFGNEPAGWSKGAIGFQRVASYDVGDFLFCLNANAGSGTDVSTSDEKMRIKYDGRVGIGTPTPQYKLDVVTNSNSWASFGRTLGVGDWAGLHFGYSETGNTNYRKSAIVFERTDLTEGNAQGKVHILNGPQAGGGSATLSDAKFTIREDGHVGIGDTNPESQLEVNEGSNYRGVHVRGSNTPSFTLAKGTTSTPEWRLGISGYDGSDFAISTGSTVNDQMRMDPDGNVAFGLDGVNFAPRTGMHNDVPTLQTRGPLISGSSQGAYTSSARNTRDWFVYAGPPTNTGVYVHMKTNLDMGTSSNTEFTMSSFTYHNYYAYGGSYGRGQIGWHNWSGSFYNVTRHNEGTLQLVQPSYVSSDGYAVLVALIDAGYAQFSIDWFQWAGYTFREAKVTAVTQSSSATGAY